MLCVGHDGFEAPIRYRETWSVIRNIYGSEIQENHQSWRFRFENHLEMDVRRSLRMKIPCESLQSGGSHVGSTVPRRQIKVIMCSCFVFFDSPLITMIRR